MIRAGVGLESGTETNRRSTCIHIEFIMTSHMPLDVFLCARLRVDVLLIFLNLKVHLGEARICTVVSSWPLGEGS